MSVHLVYANNGKRLSYEEVWGPTQTRKYLFVQRYHAIKLALTNTAETAYVVVDEDDDNLVVTNIEKWTASKARSTGTTKYSKFIFSSSNSITWYKFGAGLTGNSPIGSLGTYPTAPTDFNSIFDKKPSISIGNFDNETEFQITFDPTVQITPATTNDLSKVIFNESDFRSLMKHTYDSIGKDIKVETSSPIGGKDPY